MEEWRPCIGFDMYEVSSWGRIVNIRTGRMLRIRNQGGYKAINLSRNGVQECRGVHRLVANAFLGDIVGLDVIHKDLNKSNNNVDNLEIVTQSENMKYVKLSGKLKGSTGTTKCFRVRCLETRVEFSSIREAGWIMELSPNHISQHLRGIRTNVKGWTFERLI